MTTKAGSTESTQGPTPGRTIGFRTRAHAAPARIVLIPLVFVGACLMTSRSKQTARPYTVPVPLGLDVAAPVPDANPLSAAKIDLGRSLFFDPVISADSSMSCASCHQPGLHFTDGRPRAIGIHGRVGRRSVPSILNVAYGRAFFWDGRAASLEEQVVQPIQGERELGLDLDELIRRLDDRQAYRTAFERAFGDTAITSLRVARALASYLRTLRSGDAPIDRFMYGDTTALSPEARRGFRLFVGRANCSICHRVPLFTDQQFHNTGVSWGAGDTGRYDVTGDEADLGAFKVPSLRNVAATAPYMHDGSLATLEDVLEHYDRGGTPNPHLDEEIRPLHLTAAEKHEIIAFLHSLTEAG